jgi:exodeoxyribonuclease V alpha subunit
MVAVAPVANKETSQSELLRGVVERIVYRNEENGYFVARVDVPYRGIRTVTGIAPSISVGEEMLAEGTWVHSNWGPQLKATRVALRPPTVVSGIEKFLAYSVEGVGKTYAKKLVEAFGAKVFEVIENDPEKLRDVPGIGKKRASSIVAAYQEQRTTREVLVFLHRLGVGNVNVKRIVDYYAKRNLDPIKSIEENPYQLTQIWGIGFGTADAAALRLGIEPDSMYRIRAAVRFVLQNAVGQGSCGLPIETVVEIVVPLLKGAASEELVRKAIDLECTETYPHPASNLPTTSMTRATTSGKDCLFLTYIYRAEHEIAKTLLSQHQRPLYRPIANVDAAIAKAEKQIGINLEEVQREAVRVALSSSVCILTGGPGTGKTTVTKVILQVLENEGQGNIALSAPTGKAAKRASEATGRHAKTLHRTLEVMDNNNKFRYNRDNRLDVDAWVIDEMSMVDVNLMHAVCQALHSRSRLLLIGDVDQLPSVGPGKVLSDIIDAGVLPTVRLRTVFRQAKTSHIITNAHRINSGQAPAPGAEPGSDFWFHCIGTHKKDDDEHNQAIRESIAKKVLMMTRDLYKLGYDPIKDVQVLAPMRKGPVGVERFNKELQALLNPHPSASMEAYGTRWCVGDKVMQRRNNYNKLVFNGDIGYIVRVSQEERAVEVDFDGQLVVYHARELDELSLAYAFTIHKSQGSEFPVVIIPVDYSHYMMLKRNLLYTAVTRARKLCVIVGENLAVQKAVQEVQMEERYSLLKDILVNNGLPRELATRKSGQPVVTVEELF